MGKPTDAIETQTQRKPETVDRVLDATPWLDSDETISHVSGTDTAGVTLGVSEEGGKVLATNVAVNDAEITIGTTRIAVGKGLLFTTRCPEATAGTQYWLVATFKTSKGETLSPRIPFRVEP